MREGKRPDSSSSSSSSLLNRDFFSQSDNVSLFCRGGVSGGKTTGVVECMSLIHYPHFLRFKTSTVIIAVLTYINTTVISFGERSTYDIYPQQAAETQRLCMSVWLCVFIGSGMHLCICVSVEHWWFIQETVLFTPCRAHTIWQAGWHSLLTSLSLAKSATPQCCLMLIKTWSTKQTVSEKRKKKPRVREKKKSVARLFVSLWLGSFIAVLLFLSGIVAQSRAPSKNRTKVNLRIQTLWLESHTKEDERPESGVGQLDKQTKHRTNRSRVGGARQSVF